MEAIFKIDLLRKEFEKLHKEVLVDALMCNLCQKTACQLWHCKFLVSCKYCRENHCKVCKTFNSTKDLLFKNLDDPAKDYVQNFIRDFLNLSSESLQNYYQITKTVPIP